MKKCLQPKYVPLLALCGGVLGFFLRLWLFSTGVDEKGLLRQDHPAAAMVFILTGLVLLGIYLCLRPLTGQGTYRRIFPRSPLAAIGCWVGAIGILITDIVELASAADSITFLSGLFGIAAAGCLVVLGWCRWNGARPNHLLHGIVTVYLLLHLVSQYRLWSAESQLQVYFFQLLASLFLMLSTYHRTTLDAGKGSRRQFLFFQFGALFFCCMALFGETPLFYLTLAVWAGTVDCFLKPLTSKPSMDLPQNVHTCLRMLHKAGFDAYVVGGCVRDSLLGLVPQDYDICTAARPEQIAQVFSEYQLVHSGEKHGTVGVVMDGINYEITTFRTEGGYSDSRHPDWVEFVSTVEADLARRDFTVNAMAYSPAKGYVDPWDGQADLNNHVLRTVGDPTERFTEDALRILRGVRFAVCYHLLPHPDTENAMLALTPTMDKLARERVFLELCKLLPYVTAEDLLRYQPILTQVIPELAQTVGFAQQNPHHIYDVYTHTAHAVEAVPPVLPLRLAALLHDIGKPATFTLDAQGCGHFYDHAAVGAEMADVILTRLRAPTALRQQVVFLITQHMLVLEPDEQLLRRRVGKFGEESLRQLLALQKADRMATGTYAEDIQTEEAEQLLDRILAEDPCLTIRDLQINGDDLIAAGFTPGPGLGKALTTLLELVIDQQLPNEKTALLAAAEALKEDA